LDARRSMWLNVIGRLNRGVSRASAEAALNVFWKPILQDELSQMTSGSAQFKRNFLNRHITLRDASNGISLLRMMFAEPMTLLMGLVGLVLLIACANVANLLIARAAGRQREIAIRLALGASSGHIVRQILSEALILAITGGALGLLFAIWFGRALLAFLPFGGFTATISADPDWRILAFTAAVSLACGVMFGLAPALQASRADLASTNEGTGGSSDLERPACNCAPRTGGGSGGFIAGASHRR
jgi:ABC-type antimicrobial peptide transport system permease subunit